MTTPRTLPRGPSVLAVVAHPDDETIWCGNTLASLAAAGRSVLVLSLTHGDDAVRRAEFEAACALLGVLPVMARLPDDKRLPLGCERVDLDALLAVPDLVLTHGPEGETHRHPHHVDCARFVAAWAGRRGVPVLQFDPDGASREGLERHRVRGPCGAVKQAALRCHVSQQRTLASLPPAGIDVEAFVGTRRAFETLMRMAPVLDLQQA